MMDIIEMVKIGLAVTLAVLSVVLVFLAGMLYGLDQAWRSVQKTLVKEEAN